MYVGEIRYFGFNFSPVGWRFCDGSLLPIAEYQPLFALIGNRYGGDGERTFALPDLRDAAAVHRGAGRGLPSRAIWSKGRLVSDAAQESSEPTVGALAMNASICVEGYWPVRD